MARSEDVHHFAELIRNHPHIVERLLGNETRNGAKGGGGDDDAISNTNISSINKEILETHETNATNTVIIAKNNKNNNRQRGRNAVKSAAAAATTTTKRTNQQPPLLLRSFSILVRTLLALLLVAGLIVSWIRHLHDHYYTVLSDRARRTDSQLREEFTYYERVCTPLDITATSLSQMLIPVTESPTTATASTIVPVALQTMMQHGGIVLANVLDNETIAELRKHIVHRNGIISAQDRYPVSQGDGGTRVSYGIDATEHPAVTNAVRQVATHPLLRPLLQHLLGDTDPASAEITAITAYAGAEDQAWHADTKGDGNALKFARTYSHSYSLFMPLQDITPEMGATDVCPGTHYCANDLENACEQHKLSLHNVDPIRKVFPAGHAALLNQHVWHRGAAHTDPDAPERIVFIMSFLARPPTDRPETGDTRQLSRGTYFHQRWNMWGHTWKDLLDPMASMQQPFSTLRSLGLWKPPSYSWGYDFITSALLRASNDQLEEGELTYRFWKRLNELQFPIFLRGRILESDDLTQQEQWQIFVSETINNTWIFVSLVGITVHVVYFLISILVVLLSTQPKVAWTNLVRNTRRILVTYGIIALVAWVLTERVRTGKWAQNVRNGRELMRPFPLPPNENQSHWLESHVSKLDWTQDGLTTLPTRWDILVGTRYEANFLGCYDRWLDFHPGNKLFLQNIQKRANLYHSYRQSGGTEGLARAFTEQLVNEVIESNPWGRFLYQEYRTGLWRLVEDGRPIVHYEFVAQSTYPVLRKSLHWLIAGYRFGFYRDTALAMASLANLKEWRDRLFPIPLGAARQDHSRPPLSNRKPLELPTAVTVKATSKPMRITSRFRHFLLPSPSSMNEFSEGCLVWVRFPEGDAWYPGAILSTQGLNRFEVSYEDGSTQANVSRRRLFRRYPVVEGDVVEGCFLDELEDCYSGTIDQVHPSGTVAIAYDDGEFDPMVTPDRYFIPPFKYGWPYYF